MQVVDASGNVFGQGLEITDKNGKPKVPVINTDITIGTTAIVSGVVGRVLFQGAGNVVQQSANLFWDNTNGRLGIGTASPTSSLHINSTANINVVATLECINLRSTYLLLKHPSRRFRVGVNISVASAFEIYDENASANRFVIQTTGNIGIGTTTDAGYKLDVNGTARVSSSNQIPLRIDGSTVATGVQINSQADNDLRPSYLEFLRGGVSKFFVGFNYGNSGFYIGDGTNPNFNMKSNGNILIGTFTDVASSLLTMQSTTKGFLPPRMDTTQKNAIASPAEGLQVWDTTLKLMFVYNGTTWISL